MKSPEGGEKGHLPQYPGEYKIQSDSIHKIGMNFSKKKTSGKQMIYFVHFDANNLFTLSPFKGSVRENRISQN